MEGEKLMKTDYVIVEYNDFPEFQRIAKETGLEFSYKESDGKILILNSLDNAEKILLKIKYEQFHRKHIKTQGGFMTINITTAGSLTDADIQQVVDYFEDN